ncbi:hypothetical protein V7S57_06345 [Caulobacter sp. CCNWLY153]|jgi:hypothetical protein|uniref:hypothetical protein n=1 Tax=Caulobacter TaxID=75 RepID=UPI001057E143|nr:hypothetical protein [Caulobacter radicis]
MLMSQGLRRVATMAVIVCLGATGLSCSREVDVTISGSEGAPKFQLKGAKACVTALTIRTDDGATALWHLGARDCRNLSEVAYGVTPEGFWDRGPAREIGAGPYRINASGPGWRGSARFAIANGKYKIIPE